MLIDIGLNLTNSQFRKDTEQVIHNALAAGVSKMIITGTDLSQSTQALQLARQYPGVLYSTVGIHPHDARSFNAQSVQQMRQLLSHDTALAIGECGLDFNRNYSSPAQQLHCFEAQLELAASCQLPVFLHQRDAHNDFLDLIRHYRPKLVNAVAHCFTGDRKQLQAYLDEDLYIGITGWLCDERRGKDLQQCVQYIPLDRIMIETDAPYLLPRDLILPEAHATNKTRRNEPQYLPHILKRLASLMRIDEHELAQLTSANSRHFFSL